YNMIANILQNLGFDSLNEMQEQVFRAALKQDVVLMSPTGSGKTLAFLLPAIARLKSEEKGLQAIIIAPSRELAVQIAEIFRKTKSGYKLILSYGGHSVRTEQHDLSGFPAVL